MNFFSSFISLPTDYMLEDTDCVAMRTALIEKLATQYQAYQDKQYAFVGKNNLPVIVLPIFADRSEAPVAGQSSNSQGMVRRRQLFIDEISNCKQGFLIGIYNFGAHYVAYLIYRHAGKASILTMDSLGGGQKGKSHPAGRHFLNIVQSACTIRDINIQQQFHGTECGFLAGKNVEDVAIDILSGADKIVFALQRQIDGSKVRVPLHADISEIDIDQKGFTVKHGDRTASYRAVNTMVTTLKKVKTANDYDFNNVNFAQEYQYDDTPENHGTTADWERQLKSTFIALKESDILTAYVTKHLATSGKIPNLPRDAKGFVNADDAPDLLAALAKADKTVGKFVSAEGKHDAKYYFFNDACQRIMRDIALSILRQRAAAVLRDANFKRLNLTDIAGLTEASKTAIETTAFSDDSQLMLATVMNNCSYWGTFGRDVLPKLIKRVQFNQARAVLQKQTTAATADDEVLRVHLVENLAAAIKCYDALFDNPRLKKLLYQHAHTDIKLLEHHQLQPREINDILVTLDNAYYYLSAAPLSRIELLLLWQNITTMLYNVVQDFLADPPNDSQQHYGLQLKRAGEQGVLEDAKLQQSDWSRIFSHAGRDKPQKQSAHMPFLIPQKTIFILIDLLCDARLIPQFTHGDNEELSHCIKVLLQSRDNMGSLLGMFEFNTAIPMFASHIESLRARLDQEITQAQPSHLARFVTNLRSLGLADLPEIEAPAATHEEAASSTSNKPK